jgi:hypothetical protein
VASGELGEVMFFRHYPFGVQSVYHLRHLNIGQVGSEGIERGAITVGCYALP